MQVAAQTCEGGMATVRQFHFNQRVKFGARLELDRHVVVKHAHATLCFDLP